MAGRVERLRLILEAQETKLVKGLKNAGDSLARLDKQTKKTANSVDKSFRQLDARLSRTVAKIKQSATGLRAAMVAIGAGAAATAPIKFAADFEKALANVDTLLVDASVSIEKYREQLLKLAQASSKELIDLTQGLYQTISAGIPVVEGAAGAFAVLEQAQRAAVAGLATTEQAVDVFTTVLNAYSDSTLTAAEVSDKLFTTVRIGKTTFPELASSLGRVATIGAKFGISIDEILASVASLTKAGLSTDEAMTQLRSTIIGLASPAKNVQERLADMGIEIGEAAFQSKGLSGVLTEIAEATGGSADEFAKLFPNVRALVGSLVLGSGGVKSFKRDIDQLAASTGATDAAYQKISKTFSDTFAIFKSQVNAVLIEAGQRVLPRVQSALKDLGDFVVSNQERIGEAFDSFISSLFSIGEFIVSFGPGLVKFMATFFLASRIAAASIALKAFNRELKILGAARLAGVAAGGKFLTGFQSAVKGIPGMLSRLLRSPTALGLFVAVGIAVGSFIIDGITDAVNAAEKKAVAKIRAAEAKRKVARDKSAKRRGFKDETEEGQIQAVVARGEALNIDQTTSFRKGNVLTAAKTLSALGVEALVAETGKAVKNFQAIAVASDLQGAHLERSAASALRTNNALKDQLSSEANIGREKTKQLTTSAAEFRLAAVNARNAAQAAVDRAQSAVEDFEFAKADKELTVEAAAAAEKRRKEAEKRRKGGAKGRASQAAAEKLRIAFLAEAIELSDELFELRLEKDEESFNARKAQVEAIITLDELATERAGGNVSELDKQRSRAADARISLLEEEQVLVADLADRQISELQRLATETAAIAQTNSSKLLSQFRGNATARIGIEQALATTTLAIREKLALDVAKIESETSAKQAGLSAGVSEEDQEKRRAEARVKAFTEASARIGGGPGLGFVAESTLKIAKIFQAGVLDGLAFVGPLLLNAAEDFSRAILGGILDAADRFVDAVSGPVSDAINAPIDRLLGSLSAGVSELLDLRQLDFSSASAARKAITDAAESSVKLAERIARVLPGLVEQFFEATAEALPPIIENVARALAETILVVAENIGSVIDSALTAFGDALPGLGAALEEAAPKITEALIDGSIRILDALPQILEGLGSIIGASLDVLLSRLGEISTKFAEAITAGLLLLLPALPGLFENVFDALIDSLEGVLGVLSENAGELVNEAVVSVLQVHTALLERLPEFVEVLVKGVLGIILDIVAELPVIIGSMLRELPRLLGALIGANLGSIIGGINGIGEALIEFLDTGLEDFVENIPAAFEGLLAALPGLLSGFAASFLPSLGRLFFSVLPRLLAGVGNLILEAIPAMFQAAFDAGAELLSGLIDYLSGTFLGDLAVVIADAVLALGEMIIDALGDLGGGLGDFVSRTLGISAVTKLATGEDLGLEDVPVVGGLYAAGKSFLGLHRGGTIGNAGRNILGAAQMFSAGAKGMASGGFVTAAEQRLRSQFRGLFADDVPTVLQAGEGVLRRQTVDNIGGPAAVDRLNNGGGIGGGTVLNVIARDSATEALLAMLVERIVIEGATPGSQVRTMLDGTDPFLGSNFVRGRVTG